MAYRIFKSLTYFLCYFCVLRVKSWTKKGKKLNKLKSLEEFIKKL